MENKLKDYVNGLFKELNQTESLQETKEELILNLTEKYHDLLQEGLSPEQAYKKVIASIGDLDELIEVETNSPRVEQKVEVNIINHKKGNPLILQIIATILFITCPVPLLAIANIDDSFAIFGVIILLIMVAIGVGLLIYANHDEDRKEKEKPKDTKDIVFTVLTARDRNRLKNINGLVYLIAAILFFSNILTGWGFSFVVFIAAYGVTKVIELIWYTLRLQEIEKQKTAVSMQRIHDEVFSLASSTIWTVAVVLFFTNTMKFSFSWIVFLIAAAVVQIVKIVLDTEDPHEKN